mmetsp:Transcript_98461/g.211061  ORF Transcript_98461/g.211061 Transcript_98461/m.211061 type:complete len:239 (-) Transcript_98461:457-1173(-)
MTAAAVAIPVPATISVSVPVPATTSVPVPDPVIPVPEAAFASRTTPSCRGLRAPSSHVHVPVTIDRPLDHALVVHIRGNRLDDHFRLRIRRDLEVGWEDAHPIDELLPLMKPRLDLLHTRLLAQLLDRSGATTPLEGVDQLNAEGLDLLLHAAGVINAVRQHELGLVHKFRCRVGVGKRGLRARLQLHHHATGHARGRHELENVLILLEDVQQAPILKVVVLLDLGNLEVRAQLRERD